MGKKKNKKSRAWSDDEDEVPIPTTDNNTTSKDAADALEPAPSPSTTAEKSTTTPPPSNTTNKTNNATAATNNKNDLSHLRDEMKNILRRYGSAKPDDWLARSLEKNLKLKKKSIDSHSDAFDALRDEVETELENEEPVEEEEEEKEEDTEETLKINEARRRAEARVMGTRLNDDDDEDDNKGAVAKDDRDDAKGKSSKPSSSSSPPNSLLLSLRPYVSTSSFPSTATSPLSFLYAFLFHLLSFLLGQRAVQIVEDAHAAAHAGEIAAYEDKLRSTHLWCPRTMTWMTRDATYDATDEGDLPVTIRWNATSRKWERWCKNLKTKLSKKKKAAAESADASSSLTKGSWFPVKIGDGWVSAPSKAESDDDLIGNADVRFYACWEEGIVVDCTSWVSSALMTRETPRALGVVDGGKVVFRVSAEEGKGVEGWVLSQYAGSADGDDDGGGNGVRKKKGGKEKASRADKKAKKLAYGR
mmetsp:Transcript_6732/g.8354  ORF Transcript_6732/g.8354 Transcript_6732/m.8354 type:complete len:473 (+) Transcript_6732:67-1485(+)|eukprot:CAMPEP_0172506602 /NCGR_PEP_ID=MMETSP1066-20121228/196471_1 /TAXON_ID=671091 /ORGANISM="Coscinodiscus wailesii, Strain CCMP2513" /LENGTH=472 /DNA_ID=CAMNT_0013283691 /DNA_START=64 /DNA_END=1482 /DNA_ORIENTATION=-